MKHIKLILPVLALLFVSACASLERNAYVTIGITAHSVDAAMNTWGDYVRAGSATPDQQTTVKAAFEKYQVAMRAAHTAVSLYQTSGDKPALQIALDAAAQGSTALINLITIFLPPDKAATLKPRK